MKRVSALIIAMLMVVACMAPACMAAKEDLSENSVLKIEESTPKDGDKGVSVENLSVKLTFNQEMYGLNDAQKKQNMKSLKLTDPKGKKVKVNAYYSKEHPNMVMVVSGVSDSKMQRFESATEYTLTIGKNFQAANGTKLGEPALISFTTFNQDGSMKVYMLLMVLMMVGMVYFTTRSTKKALEKEKKEKGETETVNPYKEAKRTGKSVEEIVAEDKKKKEKAAKIAAKRRAEEMALEEEIMAQEAKKNNKRVAVKKPISAAGSEYKVQIKKPEPKKQSTNPKGQTGKQKNKNKNKNK